MLTQRARFHEKLRKFLKKELEKGPAEQVKVRVLAQGTTVTLRGPKSAVDELAKKAEAFVAQAKEDEKERGFTLSFDFPQKYANKLIGRQGSKINELRERFDVEIQIDDGKVEVKGPKAKAEEAQKYITSLGRQLADETTYVLKIDPQWHKDLIGKEGSQAKRLENRYAVQIWFGAPKSKRDEESGEVASDSGRAKRAADEVVIHGGRKGADEARDELLSLVQYLKDTSHSATVSVAQKHLPRLIGSGGKGVEDIRQESGARIDVPKPTGEGDDAVVEISIKGTKEQVAKAKKILQAQASVLKDTVVRTIEIDRKYHRDLIGAEGTYRSISV